MTAETLAGSLQQLIAEEVARQIATMKPAKAERWLTKGEACQYLGVSRATLYNWEKRGLLKPYRIESIERYSASQLDEFMEGKRG